MTSLQAKSGSYVLGGIELHEASTEMLAKPVIHKPESFLGDSKPVYFSSEATFEFSRPGKPGRGHQNRNKLDLLEQTGIIVMTIMQNPEKTGLKKVLELSDILLR